MEMFVVLILNPLVVMLQDTLEEMAAPDLTWKTYHPQHSPLWKDNQNIKSPSLRVRLFNLKQRFPVMFLGAWQNSVLLQHSNYSQTPC